MLMLNSASTGKFFCRTRIYVSWLSVVGLSYICVGACAQTGRDLDLFPVHRHAAWSYDVSVGRQSAALTASVTRIHTAGDTTDVTVEWSAADGHRTQTESYRVSAAEVARVASGRDGECRYAPPFPVMKFPLASGRRWTWKGTLQFQRRDVPAEAAFSATGPISVATPSGTLQAMKVHCDLTMSLDGQSRTETTDQWFAPGIGIVQQRVQNGSEVVEGRLTGYNVRRAAGSARSATPAWNVPLLRLLPHRH